MNTDGTRWGPVPLSARALPPGVGPRGAAWGLAAPGRSQAVRGELSPVLGKVEPFSGSVLPWSPGEPQTGQPGPTGTIAPPRCCCAPAGILWVPQSFSLLPTAIPGAALWGSDCPLSWEPRSQGAAVEQGRDGWGTPVCQGLGLGRARAGPLPWPDPQLDIGGGPPGTLAHYKVPSTRMSPARVARVTCSAVGLEPLQTGDGLTGAFTDTGSDCTDPAPRWWSPSRVPRG